MSVGDGKEDDPLNLKSYGNIAGVGKSMLASLFSATMPMAQRLTLLAKALQQAVDNGDFNATQPLMMAQSQTHAHKCAKGHAF
jgi:hypothetical protein